MNTDKSPFEVLGISPDAELVVVDAAYRALARKYHPDLNPGVSADELNRKMALINWAKEELERDLAGWRGRVGSARPGRKPNRNERSSARRSPTTHPVAVTVEPPVISLAGKKGSQATFRVHGDGLAAEDLKVRFREGMIDVARRAPIGGAAVFAVTLVEDFPSDMSDSAVETIEVLGPGAVSVKTFVTITPISPSVLNQQYGGRVAPPRHASDNARISFGKHRTRTFYEIAVEDPGYLEWMLREGAGSYIERQCAQMALARVRGSYTLSPRRRSQTRRALPKRARQADPPALPDPTKPKGLWGTIKALVSGR